MPFWIWLILGFVLLSFLGMFAATWPIAKKVYHNILVRTGPEKWTRANSYPPNPEHTRMFDLGMDWARENEAHKRPVSIENEGLKLAGEYFDFGHKRCAIIFPGRTESLYYSYYFAQPYAEAGCNILVVDSRAHGLSEGKYNYCSTREWSDVIAWSRFAHDQLAAATWCCTASASAAPPSCWQPQSRTFRPMSPISWLKACSQRFWNPSSCT